MKSSILEISMNDNRVNGNDLVEVNNYNLSNKKIDQLLKKFYSKGTYESIGSENIVPTDLICGVMTPDSIGYPKYGDSLVLKIVRCYWHIDCDDSEIILDKNDVPNFLARKIWGGK